MWFLTFKLKRSQADKKPLQCRIRATENARINWLVTPELQRFVNMSTLAQESSTTTIQPASQRKNDSDALPSILTPWDSSTTQLDGGATTTEIEPNLLAYLKRVAPIIDEELTKQERFAEFERQQQPQQQASSSKQE